MIKNKADAMVIIGEQDQRIAELEEKLEISMTRHNADIRKLAQVEAENEELYHKIQAWGTELETAIRLIETARKAEGY